MYFCSICENTYEDIEVAMECCMDKIRYDDIIRQRLKEERNLLSGHELYNETIKLMESRNKINKKQEEF